MTHNEKITAVSPRFPKGERDIETIRQALSHLNPGCERSSWIRIGLALRHQFHDDPDTGHSLFDLWSSGGLWPEGKPSNYEHDDHAHQWNSFQLPWVNVNITIATLFFEAAKEGWRPPAALDHQDWEVEDDKIHICMDGLAFAPQLNRTDLLNMLKELDNG